MNLFDRKAWAPALLLCTLLAGCGTPGAPQPPSLNLPDTVTDLAATRTGNHVTLTWTMPKRNTDRTILKTGVTARICRREGSGSCSTAGVDQSIAAGKPASYTDTLSGPLASGEPRPVSYFVELLNKKDRSAGVSNPATVLLGNAPGAVDGLKAEVRKQGVVLSWTPDNEKAAVRLQRKLLTPAPPKSQSKSEQGPLAPAPEPIMQSLLVETGTEQGRAIDSTAHFDETYEYRAQRVVRIELNGKTLELPGEVSAPIDVDVKDVFPPAVPSGLAAVASATGDGTGPSIDLNWQPNTEPDLAGYIVYRREEGGAWVRVSPATPAIEPAFHDTQVQPGHTYRYAVSAVDKGGHESERSAEAEETVPQP
jgi:hypothetical protein